MKILQNKEAMAQAPQSAKHLSGIIAATAIALVSACASVDENKGFQGLAPEKQNEVEQVRLTHEIRLDPGSGTLSPSEEASLHAFLARANVGYGDRLSLDDATVNGAQARVEAISAALGKHGINLSALNTIAGAALPAGSVRLVVDRYTVTTPGCGDFSQKAHNNFANATSSNFGCTTASNLGAMIADPRDLIDGPTLKGTSTASSDKAIEVFKAKTPTGAGDLENASTGSGG